MSDLVGSPDIILVLPFNHKVPEPKQPLGYSVSSLPRTLDSWWIDIHRKAVPSFSRSDLTSWLERYREISLDKGILVAVDDSTQEPVSTAGSISNSKDGMFPKAGQLGWVATVPDHRGHGLGTWLSALATIRLQQDGFRRIFLCTGEDMPAAIQIYLQLGYTPCLYASDQHDRWQRICEKINFPFEPTHWQTPQQYLSGTSS